MKPPKKISILVWFSNLMLVLLALAIVGNSYYITTIPEMIELNRDLEGATKSSSLFTQLHLHGYLTFEQELDREKGINRDSYYFTSTNKLYMIPLSDSVMVESSKINREYSKKTFSFSEFKFKTLQVSESAGAFPIHLAAPAVPLDRAQFIYLAQLSVISFIIYAVYLFIFVWFLRKFAAGLRKPGFFNSTNAQHLYTIAGLVTLAPLLMWTMETWAWPDPYSKYLIDDNSAFDTVSILPPAILTFGLILFVIAWCFDQGVKLQKEQELTI